MSAQHKQFWSKHNPTLYYSDLNIVYRLYTNFSKVSASKDLQNS